MMPAHSVTVTVPPLLYDQLRQRAERAHRTIEDEIVLALAATIPVDDALPADLQTTLASLSSLPDDALWHMARSRVPAEDSTRLEELGVKRQRVGLTEDESREADELLQLHDRIMLIRAAAAAHLHERGHDVSALGPGG